jgi:NTP pyrophosphatase (non-canonical NTP hydrolase)
MSDISDIQNALREFARERDWDQFHKPKNLSLALSSEVGELIEHFQWESDAQIEEFKMDKKKISEISDEIADVLSYLFRLSDKMEIDVGNAFWEKLKKNKAKYPVDKSKGSSKKYTEY